MSATTRSTRFRPPGPLGCGGAPLGNLFAAVSEPEADAVLEAAWSAGVRHYDTAPFYGFGLSEQRFGRALRGRARDEFVLSTKVGRLLDPAPSLPSRDERFGFVDALRFTPRFDYGRDATLRSIEASLQRLGLARIDLVYIHDVGEDTHGAAWRERFDDAMAGAAPALTRLREDGVIRGWGLGVNRVAPCLLALERSDPDCFLAAGRYTLLDQDALGELLPRAEARGASVVVGGPFNSGLLSGGDTFDYVRAPDAIVARRDRIAAICARHGVDLRAAALRFATAHPAIAAAIPGARSAAEMRDNARLIATPIPGALWDECRAERLIPDGAPTPAD